MPKVVNYNGVKYRFPDEATEEMILEALGVAQPTLAPAPPPSPVEPLELPQDRRARVLREARELAIHDEAMALCGIDADDDPAKQAFLSQESTDAPGDEPYPIEIGLAVAGAGVLGWVIARRTLLAARPKLTRKWFGVLGPVMWRCGRCGSEVALRSTHCEKCGQGQVWPRWVAS